MKRLAILLVLLANSAVAEVTTRPPAAPLSGALTCTPLSCTLTAPLLLPDGTLAAPGLAFTSDPTRGLYSSADSLYLSNSNGNNYSQFFVNGDSANPNFGATAYDDASGYDTNLLCVVDPAGANSYCRFQLGSFLAPQFVFNGTKFDSPTKIEFGSANMVLNAANIDTITIGDSAALQADKTLTVAASTGAGNAGGDLILYGGNPGAGGTRGNVQIGQGGSTSNLLLGDGTAAAPSLAFSSDTNTGIYLAAADAVAFTSGGALQGYFQNGRLNLNGYLELGAADVKLYRDAANTLALRNAGTAGVPVPQTFNVYNFCDGAACATGYERAAIYWNSNILTISTANAGTGSARVIKIAPASGALTQVASDLTPSASDSYSNGSSGSQWYAAYISRSIQGSKSKALTDNTATAFVRLTVADDDYEGCSVGWTAYAEDAGTDARQVRIGRTNVAILNNGGTESCVFSASADDEAVNVTGGTFTCTFDCNSAAADTVDLRATCDTSLDATAETLTIEYRLDCQSTITTVTPQ